MSIFDSIISQAYITAKVDTVTFLILTGVALVLGILVAITFSVKNTKASRNLVVTIAVMPMVVEIVILLVNSLTTGLAIAGIFGLVRFRSIPGNAREISNIFMAVVLGVIVGTGYIAYAVIFAIVCVLINLVFSFTKLGSPRVDKIKLLRITMPENLDYEGVFEDILEKYTDSYVCERVKTANMGSLFQVSYKIALKKDVSEKQMIDELRVRNGNLEIQCSRYDYNPKEVL